MNGKQDKRKSEKMRKVKQALCKIWRWIMGLFYGHRDLGRLVITIVVAVVLIGGFWWGLHWYIGPDKDDQSQKIGLVETLTTFLGTVVLGVVGVYFTQIHRSNAQENRFTVAATGLAAIHETHETGAEPNQPDIDRRMGAIASLGMVARTSSYLRPEVLRLLKSYLQHNSTAVKEVGVGALETAKPSRPDNVLAREIVLKLQS